MARHLSIVWFRQDLRLDDNPSLSAAARRGSVLPVYVWSPQAEGRWAPGPASRWWLRRSLEELSKSLERLGSRLLVARGDPPVVLLSLARETGADAVFWNHRYEPQAVREEARVLGALTPSGVEARAFHGSLLFSPGEVLTQDQGPFRVFTPFSKACLALPSPPAPTPAPRSLEPPKKWPSSSSVGDWSLLPRAEWSGSAPVWWKPGEHGALAALEKFLEEAVGAYAERRDRLDIDGTSRLSPHLRFGEVGPRRVWHEVRLKAETAEGEAFKRGVREFSRQLLWREFAYHTLYHFPHTSDSALRPEFSAFPWTEDAALLEAWQRGRTGFPVVDAAMRELSATGWMHNRARMIVASFLVKDLLVHWLHGAAWFWERLVDADLANNTFGWQWTAGCGADAAPFFRVFNPVLQGEKFDPEGAYVRRWVPEISQLSKRWIHRPWEAPENVAREAGVRLGKTYPAPIVDHRFARDRALRAFERVKRAAKRES